MKYWNLSFEKIVNELHLKQKNNFLKKHYVCFNIDIAKRDLKRVDYCTKGLFLKILRTVMKTENFT